jgi:thiol:disulfide interchange protein DsbD
MIPITVSYFTRTAGSSRREGLVAAGVYCAGIVLTFTGLGLGLAALLGATGINQFAANPWLNLGIAALFLAFALNLFGLYQVSIPSALLTRLGRSGGSSHAGTLLMGLTFTLTSFTCTVPFVGTVLVATASGDWLWPAAGMLAFSLVFAAPFFALALLPGLVARLPRSGGWLGSVKATMGFLEAAAAMKFLSNADLVWGWGLFSRRTVLVVWLALALAAAAYLLGRLHLPHEAPVGGVGAVRLAGVLLVLAAGGTLLAGLFGAGLGELDAFLPPRTAGSLAVTGPRGRELSWHLALRPALEQARAERKPVLIDFTGYTCTNCRWMEANLLPLPAVAAELERFVRVQLYTDGTGPEHADNQRYQRERFGTVALPLYAVVDADGATLGTFPGMTRDAGEFVRFLQGIPRPAALGQRSTKTTIMSVTTAACPRRVGSG